MSYFDYINAGFKVMYDKSSDYVLYYAGYNNTDKNMIEGNDDADELQNYDSFLNIETYEKEGRSVRICPPSSYYNAITTFFAYPTHIIDNIYLGSAFNAASYETLKDLDIKVIINATSEISEYYPDEFTYLRYKLYDNNKNSIKKYLEKAYSDIKHQQQEATGNILIHCYMGASRSASIVIFYLMKTKLISFDEAFTFVKEKRIIVNPTFRLTKDLASSMMIKYKDKR